MQFNKHAVVGVVAWAGTLENAVHPLLSTEERVSHYFLMLSLSLNTNYDGIRQSAYRAIILAKILTYAPRAGFPHFLEAFLFSFLTTILPASKIVLM